MHRKVHDINNIDMERVRIDREHTSRVMQQKQSCNANSIVDNRRESSLSFLYSPTSQMISEDEEILQEKFYTPIQKKNETGMPDNLKAGIESLSGYSMDDVRVHYNSSNPANVQALAYTQGTDIHVAPGQENHLPHEAWHVAQQMEGRVSPTTNINGMPVNDNAALEHEADVMGEKVLQCKNEEMKFFKKTTNDTIVAQCMTNVDAALNTLEVNEVPRAVIEKMRDTLSNNPGSGANLFRFGVTSLKYETRCVFHETFSKEEITIFYSSNQNNDAIIVGIGFHSGRKSGKVKRANDDQTYNLSYSVNERTSVSLSQSGSW